MQLEALMSKDNEHEQVILHMLISSVSSFFPSDYHQQTEEKQSSKDEDCKRSPQGTAGS
jgi:hypothetical protein